MPPPSLWEAVVLVCLLLARQRFAGMALSATRASASRLVLACEKKVVQPCSASNVRPGHSAQHSSSEAALAHTIDVCESAASLAEAVRAHAICARIDPNDGL